MRILTIVAIAGAILTNFAFQANSIGPDKTTQQSKVVFFSRDEIPSGFPKPASTRAGTVYTISKIKAVCNIGVFEQKAGFMEAEITHFFSVEEETVLPDWWGNNTWFFKVKETWLDGKSVKSRMHEKWQDVFVLTEEVKVKPGQHQFKIKARWDCYVPPAYWNDANIWTYFGPDGFHLMNEWYFLPRNYAFTDVVDFDMDITVPPDWYLCGSYVDPKYRDKPHHLGKYKFLSRTDSPFGYRIIGGAYEVYKLSYEESNIRMYSFKDLKGDGPFIAQMGIDCLKYFSEYFGHRSKGDYFIAQVRCTQGSGFGCEGGFVIDAPYLTRATFIPEFMAHEMAHVSWWGGDGVNGTRERPHSRFMSEAFAEVSSILYCENQIGTGYYNFVIRKFEAVFWEYCQNGAPLSSPASASSYFLTYYKGGLVLNCLRKWMGDEVFQKGIRKVIDAYVLKDGQDPDNRPRCTQEIFKKMMEEALGKSLDDFWNVYFHSSNVPVPVIDIIRAKPGSGEKDKLSVKHKLNSGLPLRIAVYFADGSSKIFEHQGGDAAIELDGQAAGLENLTWGSLVHHKETTFHTMGTSTVSAILNWRKPTIVCLDDVHQDRARLWADATGGKVSTIPPSYTEPVAVILVGPSAISTVAPEVMRNLPAKQVGEQYLEWYTQKIGGDFDMTTCSSDPANPYPALICDIARGPLPSDKSWTAFFKRSDSCFEISYRSLANGELVPPKPDFLKLPWMGESSRIYDCRFNVSFDRPKDFVISYDGFDCETFTLGKIEKPVDNLPANTQLILNLSKGSSKICLSKNTKNLREVWSQTQVYSGTGTYSDRPRGLVMDRCSRKSEHETKWTDSQKFFYKLDGVNCEKWQDGSSLLLQDLQKGKHELSMIFISPEGLLSGIQTAGFKVGEADPKLELSTKKALWKSKSVIVEGKTDPGATIEPQGTVNADGSFTVDISSDECPKTVTVTAINDCGFRQSKVIPVTKYVKFMMTLGRKTAEDYEGNLLELQVPAQLVKGSTYVPMRFIGDQLGATINWSNAEKKVTYILGLTTVEIWIGKKIAKINGSDVEMPGPPVIVDGKTLVPLRFVGSALGASITWDKGTSTATVEYPLP